jgi:hypothetical protein
LLTSVLEAQNAALVTGDRGALRIALERVRHALEELAEGEPVSEERAPADVARWLAHSVPVPQEELAALLGVGVRTLQRWLSPGESSAPSGRDEHRLRVVARVVAQLRHALGGVGAIAWFDWPRSDLGNRAPRELLDDPEALPDLMLAASAMRTSDAA